MSILPRQAETVEGSILVVGKEAGDTKILLEECFGTSMEIDCVRRFKDAMAAVAERQYDVCVCDYKIGRCAAVEFLHLLNHMGFAGSIVVLTDEAEDEIEAEYLPMGVTEFIARGTMTKQVLDRGIRYGMRSKALEHQLRQNGEMSGENLKKIVYELREPLNVVIGYVNHLLPRIEDMIPERDRKALGIVLEQGHQLSSLVDELFDIAEVETGKVKLKLQRVSVAAAIEDVVDEFQADAHADGLQLVGVCPDRDLQVLADRHRLHQVLMNLVSNGIKYTEAGKIIVHGSLGIFGGEIMVRFGVKDTGVGVAPADLPYLFDRSAQVLTQIGKSVSRTGLGLPLTASLVKLHGGHIHVDSLPGEGSEFRVWLPRG